MFKEAVMLTHPAPARQDALLRRLGHREVHGGVKKMKVRDATKKERPK
jgi:hypothetical protein